MDFVKDSVFTGYEKETCRGKVIGMFQNGVSCDAISDEGDIILDQTCFYAESGGQVADTGVITGADIKAEVTDVKKAPHKQHLHHIRMVDGTLKLGDEVEGRIDSQKRACTRANHSSLHLLQAALLKVVGKHVAQAGSFVNSEYGRFDFTHFEKLSEEQLAQIETLVNQMVMADAKVTTEVLPIEEARKTGAIALFDEKYGDNVRVVEMGSFSKEFCGGTHVANTGEIGVFKIISEESIGSGVRRITCKTKMAAYEEYAGTQKYLNDSARMLKMQSAAGFQEKLQQLLDENAALRKETAEQKQKAMLLEADSKLEKAETIGGISVLFLNLKDREAAELKNYAEMLRNRMKDGLVFLSCINDGEKVTFVCASSKAAIDKGLKAGELVKLAAEVTGGKGGGRPDMRREILEETGLTCEELTPRGILHFYSPQENDLIYVYSSRKFHGSLTPTREGTLEWVEENEILKLNLWAGDRIFLQRMMDSEEPFEYEMQYDADGQLLHWTERKEN